MNTLEKMQLTKLSAKDLKQNKGGVYIAAHYAILFVGAAYKAGEAVGEAIYHATH